MTKVLIKSSLILIIIVFAVLFICSTYTNDNINVTTYATTLSDTTETSPYAISTVSDWNYLATNWDTVDISQNVYVKVLSNISFKNTTFIKLGTNQHPYRGFFDGAGHVFSDITYNSIEKATENIGIFGEVAANSEVKNLGLFNTKIISENNVVGGLVGKNSGNITTCFANIEIVSKGVYTGGLVGINSGTISVSYSSGSIVYNGGAPSLSYVGGLVGYMDSGSLTFSYSFTKFNGVNSEIIAGGILGGVDDGQATTNLKPSFQNCFFSSDIFVTSVIKAVGANKDTNINYNLNDTQSSLKVFYNSALESNNNDGTLLSRVGFNISSLQGAWENKFKMNDRSAFFGPSLAIFNNSESTSDFSFNSVIVRRFGAIENASVTWGTEASNPYIISSAQHFKDIAEAVTGTSGSSFYTTYSGKYFLLNNDIDFTGGTFNPIGTETHQFAGKFDGNGYTLSNISISGASIASDNLAIFRFVGSEGEIKNLKIDASCKIEGGIGVGALVGMLNGGVVSDIVSEASVIGKNFVGGIVARAQNGAVIQNSLSRATVKRIESTTNNYYGIVSSTGAALINTWYVIPSEQLADYARSGSPVGAGANVLEAGVLESVNATLIDGVITFTAVDSAGKLKPVYRDITEKAIPGSGSGLYIPDITDTNKTIYLRFVRSLAVESTITVEDKILATLEFRLPDGSVTAVDSEYYDGQTVSLTTKINFDSYLKSVYFFDQTNQRKNLTDFSLAYIENIESTNLIQLNIEFTVFSDMNKLCIEVDSIFPDIPPSLSKTYDGNAVDYDYQNESLTSGYIVSFSFSTGLAPAAAGDNYSMTINILRSSIIVGRATTIFTIEKKTLNLSRSIFINYSDDSKNKENPYKEYDGLTTSVAYINKYSDSLDFLNNDADNISLYAIATYSQADPGTGLDAAFSVTMDGIAANNYAFNNATIQLNNCVIEKRDVLVSINDAIDYDDDIAILTKSYTGVSPVLSTAYEKFPVAKSELRLTIKFTEYNLATKENGSDSQAIGLGYYLITISPQENFGSAHYEVKTSKKTYLLQIVKTEVNVIFDITTDITYEIGGHNVSAIVKFDGLDDFSPGTVTYYYYNEEVGDWEKVDNITDVGIYTISVEEYDNSAYPYFVLKTDDDGKSLARITITVTKKTPSVLIDDSLNNLIYGDEKVTLVIDGDDASAFANSEGIMWSVNNQLAVLSNTENGWLIDVKGAGQIVLSCLINETKNYNSVKIDKTITIAKKTIEFSIKQGIDVTIGYGDYLIIDDNILVFEGLESLPTGYTPPHFSVEYNDDTIIYTATTPISLPIEYEPYVFTIIPVWDGGQITSANYSFAPKGNASLQFNVTITARVAYLKIHDKEIEFGDEDVLLTYALHDESEDGAVIESSIYEGLFSVTLVRTQGSDADSYEISISELINDGTFALINQDNLKTGIYTIRKKTIAVIMKGSDGQEGGYYIKTYGEADPVIGANSIVIKDPKTNDAIEYPILIGLNNSALINYIERVIGETIPDGASFGEYNYFIKDTLPISGNYTINLTQAKLRITKATPVITPKSSIEAQYKYKLGDLIISTVIENAPEGNFTWENPEYVLSDFTAMEYKYKVIFTSLDPNYTDYEFEVAVKMIERVLEVKIDIAKNIVYNGTPLNSLVSFQFLNLTDVDDPYGSLGFSIINSQGQEVPITDVIDASEYIVSVNLGNIAYIIPDEYKTRRFTVEKAPLTIGLVDMAYDVTSSYNEPQFTYNGFMANDNETTSGLLTERPTVVLPNEIGVHYATPYGAEARNYRIEYVSGKVTVKAVEIVASNDFKVTGSFDPDMKIEITTLTQNDSFYSEAVNLFNTYRSNIATLKTRAISGLYSFTTTLSNEEVPFTISGAKGVLTITDDFAERASGAITLIYFIDGNIKLAKNVSLNGNIVSFDLEECDYFALVIPEEGNIGNIILYVIIGIASLGVIALIVYIIYNKRINRKKEVKKAPPKRKTVVAQIKH
jgi:hypothetical protein